MFSPEITRYTIFRIICSAGNFYHVDPAVSICVREDRRGNDEATARRSEQRPRCSRRRMHVSPRRIVIQRLVALGALPRDGAERAFVREARSPAANPETLVGCVDGERACRRGKWLTPN